MKIRYKTKKSLFSLIIFFHILSLISFRPLIVVYFSLRKDKKAKVFLIKIISFYYLEIKILKKKSYYNN